MRGSRPLLDSLKLAENEIENIALTLKHQETSLRKTLSNRKYEMRKSIQQQELKLKKLISDEEPRKGADAEEITKEESAKE